MLPPLAGRAIGVTADRRKEELASLLRRRGARVVHGPTMATHYLHDDDALRDATEALIASPPDDFVAVTGVGVRAWIEAAEAWGRREALLGVLGGARILARGAKSAGALDGAGLVVAKRSRSEQLEELEAWLLAGGVAGRRVAVQLHGEDGLAVCLRLREAGACVVEIPVYRWELPADTGPARRLIDAACDGRLDAVTFTAAPAARNLVRIAALAGVEEQLREALHSRVAVACVGPVCAAAARDLGLAVDVAPDVGRLGLLVRGLSDLLEGRRSDFTLAGVGVVLSGSLAVVDGVEHNLPARERAVLDALAANPGKVVARAALLAEVWGTTRADGHVLDVTVARLRRRLGPAGKGIVTLPRRGYRLEAGA